MNVRNVAPTLALSCGGIALVLVATEIGVGVSPDSAAYIGAARSVMQGQGLSVPLPGGGNPPLVLYAPLFSALLGALGALGLDPLAGARCLNSALFALNILLGGYIVERAGACRFYSLLASFLLLISLPLLQIHSMAWSEPSFLFLSLLALLWLSEFSIRHRQRHLIASAVAVGLGVLSRYAGASLIIAGCLVVWLGGQTRREALRDCATFFAFSTMCFVPWLARNWLLSGTLTNHPPALHLITAAQFERAVATFVGWWWPSIGLSKFALLLVFVCLAGLTLQRAAQQSGNEATQASPDDGLRAATVQTVLVFVVVYWFFLLAVVSFFDSPPALDDRLLAPPLAWSIIATACVAQRLASPPRRMRWPGALIVLVMAWFVTAQVPQLAQWLGQVRHQGQGYLTPGWRDSEIMARVRALSSSTRVFSNADDAIYLLTGRICERVPEKISAITKRENPLYEAELTRMQRRLAESAGVVVYFAAMDWRPHLVSAGELERRLEITTVYTAADGVIYALRQ